MPSRLDGRRIVVTGSSSGMGAAIARALPGLGATVVGLDVNEPPAPVPDVRHVACDVRDGAAVACAVSEAVDHLGGLDALVHAAGIAPFGSGDKTSTEQWDTVFAVNALGTMLVNQAAYRAMQDGGRIVNFASGAGVKGYPGKAAYAASKGAVIAWTRTVAIEWAPRSITVNAIVPAIWTPMYDKTRSEMSPEQLVAHDATMQNQVPLGGRLGDADRDLVPVVAFLLSEDSRFMTGQLFAVDGGMTMVR